MSPTEIFGAMSGAIGVVKSIGELFKSGKDNEAEAAIGQLSGTLFQISAAAVSIMEENSTLKAELASRQHVTELRSSMDFDGVYLLTTAMEGFRPGTYCPGCFDSSGKMIRLQFDDDYAPPWVCPVCTRRFNRNIRSS